MTCAVVEHLDGTKTLHSNVKTAGLRLSRAKSCVIITLVDGSLYEVASGVSVKLETDDYFARTQLGVNP